MSKKTPWIILALLVSLALLMALLLAGLTGYLPSEAAVAREFRGRHPGWQVTDVTRGGGDEDGCSYSIGYRVTPSAGRREALWGVKCSGQFSGWEVIGEDLDAASPHPGGAK